MKRVFAFLFLTAALVLGSPVTMTLTGTGSEISGGFYISPYTVSVSGVPTPLVCDDFTHGVSLGQTWQANVLHFVDLSAADQPLYAQAYWLTNDILTNPAPHANDQWALWKIFDPALSISAAATLRLDWAAGEAALPGQNYSTLLVYKPVDRICDRPQEFLGLDAAEVPEPITCLLTGTGLLLFGLVWRRRSKSRN